MSTGELFGRACDTLAAKLQAVDGIDWHGRTPCGEWDVRQLVNHVVVEDLWAPPLLAGRTLEDVGDAYDGDQLGDDPVAAAIDAAKAAKAAAAEPGVESREVHTSMGLMAAEEYLMQVFADNLIHAWDVAAAIGADRTLPTDLVAECASWFVSQQPMYQEFGVVADPVPTSGDADPQTRLLASFGRDANYR
jgi:uncharacterized protein (TIGR03086 family)